MPTENYKDLELTGALYIQRKLKWYEKIWYLITRKKNEFKPLGCIKEVKINENNDKSTDEK